MLKIKDNVDLKELKKYGFRVKYDEYTGKINELYIDVIKRKGLQFKKIKNRFAYSRYPNDKFALVVKEYLQYDIDVDLLYDLIKADLVEKV